MTGRPPFHPSINVSLHRYCVGNGLSALSLDLLVKCIKADNAEKNLGFFISVFEDTGYTHAQLLFGLRSIDTVDPENIEVLLSTQFKGMQPSIHT